jgi:hypothetical protein
VARRIGNDESASRRREIPIGDVDRNSLLALSAKPVREQRKINEPGRPIDLALLHRSELIFIDSFGIMQKPADQRGFPVVYASGSRETKQVFLQLLLQERVESFRNRESVGHQK